MVRKIVFALLVYVLIFTVLAASLATFALALIESQPGELVGSYALQDGSAIVITQQVTDNSTRVEVVHLPARDVLYRVNLRVKPTVWQTEVCGGRLHLTYELSGGVYHETVDLPGANLMFLPVVCKGSQ